MSGNDQRIFCQRETAADRHTGRADQPFESSRDAFECIDRPRDEIPLRWVETAVGIAMVKGFGIYPTCIVVCRCFPAPRILPPLHAVEGAGYVVLPEQALIVVSEDDGSIGAILVYLPAAVGIGLRFATGVSLYQQCGPVGMLRIAVPLSLVPYERGEDILPGMQ